MNKAFITTVFIVFILGASYLLYEFFNTDTEISVADEKKAAESGDHLVFCTDSQGGKLSLSEATILSVISECAKQAELTRTYECNEELGVWEIGIKPYETRTGCSAVCEVNIESKSAQIQWRCGEQLL